MGLFKWVWFGLFIFLWAASSGAGEGSRLLFKDDLDRGSLERSIQRSLEFLQRVPPDRVVGEWPRKFTSREIRESLLSFLELKDLWHSPESLAQAIRSRFDIFPPDGNDNGDVLFTGYYQPVIAGSLTGTAQYRFPLYRKPADLIEAEQVSLGSQPSAEKVVGRLEGNRFVPYYSRHEIDGLGVLKGRGYEVAWVKDPVELFFLHIQGSGILNLEDGRNFNINYSASNGRPYRSIGKILLERGKISEAELSMSRLHRYLRERPEERDALFAANETYTFFRFVKEGPLGSLEVPLTPGRSIATDSRLFPKGALAFVASRRPVSDNAGNAVRWQPFSRFVVNQDTGSAIRGLKRVDLYFGSGERAGIDAGHMKSSGQLYFLIKKK